MMGFSVPLPEPRDEAEWAAMQEQLLSAVTQLTKTLPRYVQPAGRDRPPRRGGVALFVESLERIAATRGARPEVAALIRRYRELVPPAT